MLGAYDLVFLNDKIPFKTPLFKLNISKISLLNIG